MKWTIVFLSLAALAQVLKAKDCKLGEWDEWSDCTPTRVCQPPADYSPRSYAMAAAEWDEGRLWMQRMMRVKQQRWKENNACVAQGECQHLVPPASQGERLCVDGMAGEWPCRNVDQLSFVNHADLGPPPLTGTRNGNDLWGWYDEVTGDEYAIMGLTDGTSFVRITDPYNPQVLAFLPSVYNEPSTWRDIKTIGDFAFIGSEADNHGMQVYDLKHLRDMTGSETVPEVQEDAHYPGHNSHNIVASPETGYIYIVGAHLPSDNWEVCEGGLHVVDVREPLNPKYVDCFGTDGYVHDAECVIYHGPDTKYFGKEICFCYNENSLTIVDVSNKNHMHMVSKRVYSGHEYTHQGWLTEDHATLLLDDEGDEVDSVTIKNTKTYMWDITNLDDPILRNVHLSSEESIDHNQYVLGDYTYQANYQAGFRLLKIHPDYTLTEVAYFDVYPSQTVAEFAGSWSVYPYLPSGNVIVSSIEYGLFTLKVDDFAFSNEVLNTTYGEMRRFRDMIRRKPDVQCPAVVQTQQCTAQC